jgi:hypothetical protein
MGAVGDSNGGGNTKGKKIGGRNRRGKDVIIGKTRVVGGNVCLAKYR